MIYLGTVLLPSLSVVGVSMADGSTYATHEVVEGKPRRQYVGEQAPELALSLKLHVEWVDPDTLLTTLSAMRTSHEPFELTTVGGARWGTFVIEAMQERPVWLFDDGSRGCTMVDLRLVDPGVSVLAERPRPAGVRDVAEDVVTTPKGEDTSRPIGSVTPQEIARR